MALSAPLLLTANPPNATLPNQLTLNHHPNLLCGLKGPPKPSNKGSKGRKANVAATATASTVRNDAPKIEGVLADPAVYSDVSAIDKLVVSCLTYDEALTYINDGRQVTAQLATGNTHAALKPALPA